MDWGLILGVAAVIVTILGLIFRYVIGLSREVASIQQQCKTLDCIPTLKHDVDRLMYRQELEDRELAKKANELMHSPTHLDRDALMEKLDRDGHLTDAEWLALEHMVDEVLTHNCEPKKRTGASLIYGRVKYEATRARRELGHA